MSLRDRCSGIDELDAGELATGGRPAYTFDDAVLDYRRSVLYCHVYTV